MNSEYIKAIVQIYNSDKSPETRRTALRRLANQAGIAQPPNGALTPQEEQAVLDWARSKELGLID